MSRVESKQQEIIDLATSFEAQKNTLAENLVKELSEETKNWDAKIEILPNGNVRFNDPELLFETGSSKIKPKFKSILKDFFPQYLEIVKKNQKSVQEILIEGHTSSEWRNASSRGAASTLETRYVKNMELSSARALAILVYCFSLAETPSDREWLTKVLRANGMAFAKPVIVNGNEDLGLSKRVEFSVRMDTDNQLKTLIEKTKENSIQEALKKAK